MAEILLAREAGANSPSRPVVIKRALAEIENDPGVVAMFRDEARLVMSLSHPGICGMYDVGEVNGRGYIAMEWIHGATLADMIDATLRAKTDKPQDKLALPASAVAQIISEVAKALEYAHQATDKQGKPLHLVHRDVSPNNIMVGFDGRVCLLDFGLAKATTQTYKTESGIVKGKLSYLAPEQWHGAGIDGRTDLFSLGLCLYEALTGRVLYQRERPIDTMTAVTSEPPPDPRTLRPQLDARLAAVVQKALQKKPEDRFATGGQFAGALSPTLEVTDPQGQLRALMRTLFPNEATLGPTLGWLSKVADQATPPTTKGASPQALPMPPVSDSRPTRPSMDVSQAARAIRGGHSKLWIALLVLGVASAAVAYALGWRLR
jgi:serine/threonine protein kinase